MYVCVYIYIYIYCNIRILLVKIVDIACYVVILQKYHVCDSSYVLFISWCVVLL